MPYTDNEMTVATAYTPDPERYYGAGGILLSDMIEHEYNNGKIEITPFDKTKLNPNSYNVTLAKQLKKYDIYRPSTDDVNLFGGMFQQTVPDYRKCIDAKKNNPVVELEIPDEGLILKPGVLYIGTTEEIVGSDYYIPIINGRSSIGRLGMCIHVTAGFGDIGFKGRWTLEISVVEPLKIYPGMEVAQIAFYSPVTMLDPNKFTLYRGRYQGQEEAITSRYFMGKNAKVEDAEPEYSIAREFVDLSVGKVNSKNKNNTIINYDLKIAESTTSVIKDNATKALQKETDKQALAYANDDTIGILQEGLEISSKVKEYVDQQIEEALKNFGISKVKDTMIPTKVIESSDNPFGMKIAIEKKKVTE